MINRHTSNPIYTGLTFTAITLNSGVMVSRSPTHPVRWLMATCGKWKIVWRTPGSSSPVTLAFKKVVPLGELSSTINHSGYLSFQHLPD